MSIYDFRLKVKAVGATHIKTFVKKQRVWALG